MHFAKALYLYASHRPQTERTEPMHPIEAFFTHVFQKEGRTVTCTPISAQVIQEGREEFCLQHSKKGWVLSVEEGTIFEAADLEVITNTLRYLNQRNG